MRPSVHEWADVLQPEDWEFEGSCCGTDPELFFPPTGSHAALAKQICSECPVRLKCLEQSLKNNDQYGIFGGMTAKERHELKNRRNNAGKRNRS